MFHHELLTGYMDRLDHVSMLCSEHVLVMAVEQSACGHPGMVNIATVSASLHGPSSISSRAQSVVLGH